jgi:hypothetical protein
LKSGYLAFTYDHKKFNLVGRAFLTAQENQGNRKHQERQTDFHNLQENYNSNHTDITFSGLPSHHCEGSEKNSRHSFSLLPAGTDEK